MTIFHKVLSLEELRQLSKPELIGKCSEMLKWKREGWDPVQNWNHTMEVRAFVNSNNAKYRFWDAVREVSSTAGIQIPRKDFMLCFTQLDLLHACLLAYERTFPVKV